MENPRRDFLKKAALAGTGLSVLGSAEILTQKAQAKTFVPQTGEIPKPNANQEKWMAYKFGIFFHYGINTYYDKEWSDGTLDPSQINPTELDTDQWCSVAKDAGAKYVVLVTKHHDGFCNWPTKYTDYSVNATPLKIDLMKRVSDSAKKYGLDFGIYYSLWDRHEKTHDKDEKAYVEFMKNQLRELLTNYGPICELWFDGFWKKQRTGWKPSKPAGEVAANADNKNRSEFADATDFIHSWRMEGAYRWQMDHLYDFIKSIQPNCLVANNATTAFPGVPLHPVDLRCGEKATDQKSDQKIWNWAGEDKYLPLQIETTMSQKGKKGDFESGSWFWHDWDHSVASKEQVKGWLKKAEELQANLLLNCGPMGNGKLRPEDVEVLRSLKS